MSDWKERLKEELDQTNERHEKLNLFIGSDRFYELDFEDQQFLNMQKSTMETLCIILGNRYYRSTLK